MLMREVQGVKVPALGFGTYELLGDECLDAVEHALSIGYRHIDTARHYGNERAVGQAILNSGLRREDVFLATKIWFTDLAPEDLQYNVRKSLDDLQTDYVDLLMIHWPNPGIPLQETLETMADLRERGLIRNVGVSNFTPSLMREALSICPILCDQVEYHPLLGQERLLELAEDEGFLVTAYAPMAKGTTAAHPILQQIGERYHKTPSQVGLRWLLQQPSVVAIPRSSSARHRQENIEVFDFELSRDELRLIDALPKDERQVDPDFAPQWED